MKQPHRHPTQRQELGKYGEALASDYLTNRGYRIVDQNFKARYGELDIIAVKSTTLVFIEVKTRINRTYGLPEEAITPRKLHEVVLTSQYYKLLHPEYPQNMRIDAIAIELFPDKTIKDLRHIQNITGF